VFDTVVFLYVELWNWLCCLSVYLPHLCVCVCVCVCIRFHCLDNIKKYVTVHIVWILMWHVHNVSVTGLSDKRGKPERCKCEPIRIRLQHFQAVLLWNYTLFVSILYLFVFFSNGMWNLVVFVNTMWCKYACYMYALYIPNKFL